MKVIRDNELFNELKKSPKWETLFNETDLKSPFIPFLWGGLDHIEVKPKGIYFYEIGVNDKDNSFVIRQEKRG